MGAKPSRPDTASTRQVETVTGSHEFKVEGYSFDKEIASGVYLTSAVFTVGGYDWAILYYPNGSSEEDKDTLAFFLNLQSEAHNVKATLEFSLLNHSKKPSEMKAACTKTLKYKGSTWGYKKFIERKAFEKSEYLKDNSFVIKCTVTVLNSSRLDSESKIKP
ncbi:hypothetical protein LUZ60_008065 [Juncus effusus]|nr:hypothetical protein LUZ60_008065 [Juncus effusus]